MACPSSLREKVLEWALDPGHLGRTYMALWACWGVQKGFGEFFQDGKVYAGKIFSRGGFPHPLPSPAALFRVGVLVPWSRSAMGLAHRVAPFFILPFLPNCPGHYLLGKPCCQQTTKDSHHGPAGGK